MIGNRLLAIATREEVSPLPDEFDDLDYLLLYFGGEWCPHCVSFLPHMTAFYEKLKAEANLNFEVVYVSSDRDARAFEHYTSKHPSWYCLPFTSKQRKGLLDARYQVEGIPTVVIVDCKAEGMPTVTADAATNIRQDPKGLGFPWQPEPFITMLAESKDGGPAFKIRQDNGSTANISDGLGRLQDKNVAIYFGGQWCPHCVTFKPDIAGYWEAAQKKVGSKALEVVYVSSDRDQSAFNDYFGSMPKGFLAVPYTDREREKALSERFKVRGIPTVVNVSVNEQGEGVVVSMNGRGVIQEDRGAEVSYCIRRNYSNVI